MLYCTQHIVHGILLHILYCTWNIAHPICIWYTSHGILHIAYCTWHIAHGILYMPHCLLHIRTMQYVAKCTLAAFTFEIYFSCHLLLLLQRGLAPRIFEYLFSRIAVEESRLGKPSKYSIKCSFLEIYNEAITDLLAPQAPSL